MNDWEIDSHKLDLHADRVAQWAASRHNWELAKSVAPIYFEVTPSAGCQHRCRFCSVDTIGYTFTPSFVAEIKPSLLIDADMIVERMAEAKSYGVRSVMFAGTGEPLVHKHIDKINSGALDAGLDTAFTTNGVLLERLHSLPRTSWVKISLNAGTRAGYAAMHRTDVKDWDKVWDNINAAKNRRGSCTLGVQCVVLPDTVYEMETLAMLARDAGADYLVLKPYSQGTFQTSHEFEGTTYDKWEKYLANLSRYDTDTFRVIVRMADMRAESERHHFDLCRATPVFWVYAMANGDIFTCSDHLTEAAFCIGNLYRNTFKEIWEGEKRRANWQMMENFDIKHCRLNCRMAKQNVYLERFDRVRHLNFI